MRIIPAVILLLAICFLGCGGSQTATPSPTPLPVVPLNGNYGFVAASTLTQSGVLAFVGGPLSTDSAGNVTGQFHILDQTNCFALTTIASVTGTVDSQGTIKVTTNNIQSKVITVNATVSKDGKTITGGTYSITGTACDAGDQGTLTGFQVQPFSGTYVGQISTTQTTANITATLSQSATADANGLFHQTGSVAFSGSACFTSATISTSAVAGALDILELTANDGAIIDFTGVTGDGTSKTVSGAFTITGGSGGCAGQSGQITMVRQ